MANKCIFCGRLTADATLTETSNGTSICRFSLAVKRDFSTKNEADFIDFVAFKQNADYISKCGKKGMLCYVEGRLQTFTKNGTEPAQKPEKGFNIAVDKFEILSTKEEMKRYNNREEVESVPQRKHKMQVEEDDGYGSNPFDNIPF